MKRNKVRRYLRRGAALAGCNATCIDASVARNLEDVVNTERTINIFPNPSQGEFKVELENFEGTTEIVLYNFYGRVVQSQVEDLEGKKFTLDMGRFNLRQGKYFLRIVSGKKSYSRTITIQK